MKEAVREKLREERREEVGKVHLNIVGNEGRTRTLGRKKGGGGSEREEEEG